MPVWVGNGSDIAPEPRAVAASDAGVPDGLGGAGCASAPDLTAVRHKHRCPVSSPGKSMPTALDVTAARAVDAAASLSQINPTLTVFDRPRSEARTENLAVLFSPRRIRSQRSTFGPIGRSAAAVLWSV
jgi:hypothetical protein